MCMYEYVRVCVCVYIEKAAGSVVNSAFCFHNTYNSRNINVIKREHDRDTYVNTTVTLDALD